jgi:hypothetical protein
MNLAAIFSFDKCTIIISIHVCKGGGGDYWPFLEGKFKQHVSDIN